MKRATSLPDSVAIVSGGLDSTTLVYDMMTKGYTPHLLSFDYGQRHHKELQYAARTASELGLSHDVVDLQGLRHLISNSALTSAQIFTDSPERSIEVPEGHYAEENMKATVVPNRNMIMLSIAAAVAVNNSYKVIAIGVHAGDHFIYPDCRPSFIYNAGYAIAYGNEGFANFRLDPTQTYDDPIYAPFLNWSKADITFRALELGVPLHLTWSCYKGEDKHCGKCGTCVERLEAINEALSKSKEAYPGQYGDKTEYEDTEYWRTQVNKA